MKETTKNLIKTIIPDRDYNLGEIAKKGLMGEGKTYFICKNIVNEERWQPEKTRLLKAEKRGGINSTVYLIKGQNLINYLKANE